MLVGDADQLPSVGPGRVLGDVIDAASNLAKGTFGSLGSFGRAAIRPIDETSAQYLLSLEVADRPGAPVAAVINETMVRRFFPNEDPLGKRFTFGPLAQEACEPARAFFGGLDYGILARKL